MRNSDWISDVCSSDLLVNLASPTTIHEVGCGEGYWTLKWTQEGMAARGSDFSSQVIELAKQNAESRKLSPELFQVGSIYNLHPARDSADQMEEHTSELQSLMRISSAVFCLKKKKKNT